MSTLLRALNENEFETPDKLGRLLNLLLDYDAEIPGMICSTCPEKIGASVITDVIAAARTHPVITSVYLDALDTTYWFAGNEEQVEQAFIQCLRDQGVEPDLMP